MIGRALVWHYPRHLRQIVIVDISQNVRVGRDDIIVIGSVAHRFDGIKRVEPIRVGLM